MMGHMGMPPPGPGPYGPPPLGCPPPQQQQQQQQPPPLNSAGSPSNNMPPGNPPVSLFNVSYLDEQNETCSACELFMINRKGTVLFCIVIYWLLSFVTEHYVLTLHQCCGDM